MSDEFSPGPLSRYVPSKSRIVETLGKVAFPSSSERHQRMAGQASANRAVRISGGKDEKSDVAQPDTADMSATGTDGPPSGEGADLPGFTGRIGPELEDQDDPTLDPEDFEHAGHVGYEPEAGEVVAAKTQVRPTPSTSEEPVHDPTVAAFFDVDNTLIQGASIILLARGLAKHKFFTSRDLFTMLWQQTKFRVSGRESMSDVASGREKALSFVKGREVREVEELSEEVFEKSMTDRFWPGTKALAQMHLDAGQQVWLVTATPVELARVIAKRLGVTGALGTVAESVDGVYTGRLVGDILHGSGKAHAVEALAAEEGFDLDKCYAYSDSHNDMPMLSLVGNPVAINPDAQLKDIARERGWQVKDFRTVRKAAKVGMQASAAAAALGMAGGAYAAWRDRR